MSYVQDSIARLRKKTQLEKFYNVMGKIVIP